MSPLYQGGFLFFYLDIKEPKDQGCIVFMIQWDCDARKKYELVSLNWH